MVRTEKRPQGARRQVRHDPGGSPEGNNPDGLNRKEATGSPEASQGTTRDEVRKSAAKGPKANKAKKPEGSCKRRKPGRSGNSATREGPADRRGAPREGPADRSGSDRQQAGRRETRRTKRKDITRTSEGTERENACEGTRTSESTKALSHTKEKIYPHRFLTALRN